MVIPLHSQNVVLRFAKIIAAFLAILVCFASISHAAEVDAQLDRESVAAGNGAILTLEIKGEVVERPEIPEVENLIVEPQGQSRQVQTFNGTTTTTATYKYAVGSHVPGDYQIPAIGVIMNGRKFSSQPLRLKVLDAGAAQPPPAGVAPAPQGQQPPVEQEEEDTGERRFGFLTVELADSRRDHVYVGEIAPVIIRAWLPEGAQAQLRSGVQPEGKGFTLHNVSEHQEGRQVKDGKRYAVVTWFGGISATRVGKLAASLSVDATVAVRDTSAPKPQRRRTGGPFDDPFFDSAFDRMNMRMIQKDVTLKSDDQEIEVRALPAEGRPSGFTGAVGDFKFDIAEIPDEWKTGEPQQITTRLSGSGNFALMKAPVITPAEEWKTYPGKDEFTAGDKASFSGSKIFQFSAVPRRSGGKDASLAFSYFDPAAEAYKTISSPVKKIQVTGKDLVEDEPAAAPEVKEPEKKSAGLAGPHLKRAPAGSLLPLVSRPAFVPMLVISAALCVLGKVLAWLRSRREDPKRRALAAMEKATREALEAAAAAKEVAGFFAAARLAIQQRLGALWNQPAQAITSAEINARLPGDSPVVRFFQEADRHEYSLQASGGILPQWRSLLDEALASLTSSNR
ncbi:MAG: BatD family protein [Verrucomicrobiota bacterium]